MVILILNLARTHGYKIVSEVYGSDPDYTRNHEVTTSNLGLSFLGHEVMLWANGLHGALHVRDRATYVHDRVASEKLSSQVTAASLR